MSEYEHDSSDLIRLAQVLNAHESFGSGNAVEYELDSRTGAMCLQLVDRQTSEVLMKLPPEVAAHSLR